MGVQANVNELWLNRGPSQWTSNETKEHAFLVESLMQQLLTLDGLEVRGSRQARQQRKAVVSRVNQLIEQAEAALHANSSSDEDSAADPTSRSTDGFDTPSPSDTTSHCTDCSDTMIPSDTASHMEMLAPSSAASDENDWEFMQAAPSLRTEGLDSAQAPGPLQGSLDEESTVREEMQALRLQLHA